MTVTALQRVGLVVHPSRPVDTAMATIERWAAQHGIELRRLDRDEPAAPGCDLIVAVGGDGTVLAALRSVLGSDTPVLGVACGSLGALSAVPADELDLALGRYRAGDWTARKLPALAVVGADGESEWAINDFVIHRRGAGQVAVDVTVDGELYVRVAGDGVIVSTPIGTSAYSMAAGGPLIAAGTKAFACTPLNVHGGNAPPLVVPATAAVAVDVHPGFAGFDADIDGHRRSLPGTRFALALHADKVTLVGFGEPTRGLTALRRRRLITDSPRVLARDDRLHPPID